ncbi:arsenate reductase (glutaredoxin) [Pseudooceanicola sp. CBS1P-1]|uniref:Arsenate reductase n=1 Tax=Pseudooceanicola albus TaxID=2692189 RepID=A0A6L7FYH9_9RHOB|nr:arsenate reductase (glutaredoxin) [Pseudooceanicola endophyticus]MXN17134.1 arsenate reductase (glutaredoxin) [Pseudooceanicola albus]
MTLWHNPKCSKSRAALALLEASGQPFEVRRYLDTPPDLAELRALHARLGGPLTAMVRMKEPLFRDLGLGRDSDDETLLKALAENPRLIERPVAIRGERAVIGRPPEAIESLL